MRILDDVYARGTIRQYIRPQEDMTVVHETVQDTDIILDQNARMRSAIGSHINPHYHLAARIPMVVYERWIKEDPSLKQDVKRLLLKCKDREFNKFKVAERF